MNIEERRERAREARRRYRARNPHRWKRVSPEKRKEYAARYRQKNLDKVRERGRISQRRYTKLPIPRRPAPVNCECCGQPPGDSALHLDHDHETGAFRGWLCGACNRGIGLLGDSAEGIQRAALYFENVGLLS